MIFCYVKVCQSWWKVFIDSVLLVCLLKQSVSFFVFTGASNVAASTGIHIGRAQLLSSFLLVVFCLHIGTPLLLFLKLHLVVIGYISTLLMTPYHLQNLACAIEGAWAPRPFSCSLLVSKLPSIQLLLYLVDSPLLLEYKSTTASRKYLFFSLRLTITSGYRLIVVHIVKEIELTAGEDQLPRQSAKVMLGSG